MALREFLANTRAFARLTDDAHRHAEASHFWLNEGWTTYIERLLQQFLHSPAERGFQYVVGSTALYEALGNYVDRPKYQRLVIDFEPGEDPDDAYSSIPYEKGSNFLLYLGELLSYLLKALLNLTDSQKKH